jgi:CBS domain-containing membrane protein
VVKPPLPGIRLFEPLLAGAALRDRLVACIGALVGIVVTALVCHLLIGTGTATPLLVAPIGASAVLLFAVPASPLAQPWPIVGGNFVSAIIGVAAARWIPDVRIAAAVAVGGAILAMSLLRCLHPPGGAAALTAVIGGPAIAAAGFAFPFVPVALNSLLLLLAGWVFHRISGHTYPHRPGPPLPVSAAQPALVAADIDKALAEAGDAFDISRADLDLLLARAEMHAVARRAGDGAARRR